MRYALAGGGKRIRPVVCLATAEAAGGAVEDALPAAAALELVHTFSLVHDDLPAMDDDAERRGRASTHVAFPEGVAVLAGDALLADAAPSRAGLLPARAGARARRRDARDDRRAVPRHRGRGRRPRAPPPAQDRLPLRRRRRPRPLGGRRARGRAGPLAGLSGRSSACCSRSSTTCSTATGTPPRSGWTERGRSQSTRPTACARGSARSRRTRRAPLDRRRARRAGHLAGLCGAAQAQERSTRQQGRLRTPRPPSRRCARRRGSRCAWRRPGSTTIASPPKSRSRPRAASSGGVLRSSYSTSAARISSNASPRSAAGSPHAACTARTVRPLERPLRSTSSTASADQSRATTEAPRAAATRDGKPEPAAELEHVHPAQLEPGDDVRERDAARPQLCPVGKELVAGERPLVDERLGVGRTGQRELQPVDTTTAPRPDRPRCQPAS